MPGPPENRRRGPDLAPGGAPCVWMSAGLVRYKLCDRDLACDECPFDAAMRGAGAAPGGVDPERGARWEFRDDRRYHPGHTWALAAPGGAVRLGLDVFAARLLGPGISLVLPTAGSPLRQGGAGFWVDAGGEPIALASPLSGRVLERNQLCLRRPALVEASPYDEGWILEIAGDAADAEWKRLLAAEDIRRRTDDELARIHAQAARQLAADATVGPTLADGGVPIPDLRRILGPRLYRRLVLAALRA